MHIRQLLLASIIGGFMVSAFCAETAGDSQSESEKLATLRAQIPVLSAQAEIERLRADIASSKAAQTRSANGNDVGGMGGMPTGFPMPQETRSYPAPRPVTHSVQRASPSCVVAISGFDGRYHAALSDRAVLVGVGDPIGDGWVVSSITESIVGVVKGKATRTLGACHG